VVDFSDYSYVPIVAVRPAEMMALEELHPSDKDAMLPYIVFRPWLTAHHFESVLARVEAARGHRPIIVDLTPDPFAQPHRPVHDVIDELRNPANGYRNFFDFISEHENFIPSVQLSAPAELATQVRRFNALGRDALFDSGSRYSVFPVKSPNSLQMLKMDRRFILFWTTKSKVATS